MSGAPRTVTVDDKRFTRIISAPSACQISMGQLGHLDRYPYVSISLPSTTEGCKMVSHRGRRPKPLIESARHEREIMAKYDLVKD